MTVNVSFYLIAILAQRVKSHSLHGKECPVECAHCRSPSQKKYYIFSVGQLESLYNAISDKTNLKFNLLALLVLTTRIGKCTACY